MKCKTCGKNAESDFCFKCKPRKPISKMSSKLHKNLDTPKKSSHDMHEFFLDLWNEKQHYCENCRKWLGNEPLSYHFDHLLEKSKYPQLRLAKDNIMLVCLECHDEKTRGFYSELAIQKCNQLKTKYNL